jgi:thiol-disulfide isomerase/thioredoxin
MSKLRKILCIILVIVIIVASIILTVIFTNKEPCDIHQDSDKNKLCDICGKELNYEPHKTYDIGSEVGQKCPEFDLELLTSEGTVNVSDFKGKYVVLNFWGSWCPPCKAELPDFDHVSKEFPDGVAIVAVHTTHVREEGRLYVEENFEDTNIYFAADSVKDGIEEQYYNLLNGNGTYPRTFIISPEGVILHSQYGMMSYDYLVHLLQTFAKK